MRVIRDHHLSMEYHHCVRLHHLLLTAYVRTTPRRSRHRRQRGLVYYLSWVRHCVRCCDCHYDLHYCDLLLTGVVRLIDYYVLTVLDLIVTGYDLGGLRDCTASGHVAIGCCVCVDPVHHLVRGFIG